MNEPLSKDQLDAIRARADAATSGPWSTRTNSFHSIEDAFWGFDIEGPPNAERGQFARRADAEFIAHAREDIPALLAIIDAQSAEIDELRNMLNSRDADVKPASVWPDRW